MILSAHRFRSIGWIALLLVCGALVMVLAFRVNALRSQVHHTEQQIVALRKEKLYLETEVETRANQQQLKLWNDVEFGYVAPTASQYLSSERQLAAFAKPTGPDAPAPIRVASADDAVAAEAAFPAMVSELAGDLGGGDHADTAADTAAETPKPESASADDHAAATAGLGARLAAVGPVKKKVAESKRVTAKPATKPAKTADAKHPVKPAPVAVGKGAVGKAAVARPAVAKSGRTTKPGKTPALAKPAAKPHKARP